MDKPVLLLVDDRPNLVRLLAGVLGKVARVVPAGGVREALSVIEREPVAAVLCDMRMPDGDGLEVLRALKIKRPSAPFILMTAYATVDTAVQAMREGAYDHVTKPFDPDAVLALVERALASALLAGRDATDELGVGAIVGRSPRTRELAATLKRVASIDAPVLFLGEDGCGKRTAARVVHDISRRAPLPFVELSSATAPASDVAAALVVSVGEPGGTVLLREVEQLTRPLQESVASILASGRGGVAAPRVLGTSRSAAAALAEALVPELWFELNVCAVEVPALRERREDVALLAAQFLRERGVEADEAQRTFASDAVELLERYSWPGNVRELRSVVERAALAAPERVIRVASLPAEIRASHHEPVPPDEVLAQMSLKEAIELSRGETNRRYLEVVLRKFNGDVIAAADFADVERESFYRLLRRYGIAARAFRRPE